MVPADFPECHCAHLVVMLFLGTFGTGGTLTSTQGGACPQETLPGLDDPFLFTLHAWANGLRAYCHFCFASLAC